MDSANNIHFNFISNLDLNEISGGWSGLNYQLYTNLKLQTPCTYIGPINPPYIWSEKLVSKLKRLINFKGNFSFFSKKRLNKIRLNLESNTSLKSGINFFLGATPWVMYNSSQPYMCILDICFLTYVKQYHNHSLFSRKDIDRIKFLEKEWLNKADFIFFTSSWALEDTLQAYGLTFNSKKHLSVKLGGNLDQSYSDRFLVLTKNKYLLFISYNFIKKGGILCWEAFNLIRKEDPTITLKIIGEKPPAHIFNSEGVEYIGFLNKSIPAELLQYQEILSQAYFLIHPTTMDASPVVIIEAASFGCPTIAPAVFGIPDLILPGKTGFLLTELTANGIAQIVLDNLSNTSHYLIMRKSCKEYVDSELNWKKVSSKILNHIHTYA